MKWDAVVFRQRIGIIKKNGNGSRFALQASNSIF